MKTPIAKFDFAPGGLEATLEFLKRTRSELRTLWRVRVWKDCLHVIDVNQNYFEVRGLGYRNTEIVPVLLNLDTSFNPETIHNEVDAEYKEFSNGKCFPWAHERVL